MTDKMREDFEAQINSFCRGQNLNLTKHHDNAFGTYLFDFTECAYRAHQAATAESTAKIELMQARIDELEGVAEDLETHFQISKDLTSEIVEMQARIDELVEALRDIERLSQITQDYNILHVAQEPIAKFKDKK